MKKKQPLKKEDNTKGVYMAFVSKQGKTQSKVTLKNSHIIDISNAIIWCDIIKEKLLWQYKKMINIASEGDLKDAK